MLAILPAAGKGTRMAAVTGGAPKENLPLGNTTVLRMVADECAESGSPVAIVWSPAKGPLPMDAEFFEHVDQQPEPLGLGDAIRRGLNGYDAVTVALPDVVFPSGGPLLRLKSALDAGADFAVAVEEVAPERARLYGIAEIAGDEDWRIERLIEKPAPGETSSRWAVASRYALGSRAVSALLAWPEGSEFGITEVLQQVLDAGGIGLSVPLLDTEIRYDCGSPEGYAAAQEALR